MKKYLKPKSTIVEMVVESHLLGSSGEVELKLYDEEADSEQYANKREPWDCSQWTR